jgi:hypothetical protein
MPESEVVERAVILRKLLARQILKLEGRAGGSMQHMWGSLGFNPQDVTLLVSHAVCTSASQAQVECFSLILCWGYCQP